MFSPFPGSRARQQSFFSLHLRRIAKNLFAPPDGVEMFARRRAGRFMPAAIGPSNVPFELQPYVGANKFSFSMASGAGSSTISVIGVGLPTAPGTQTVRAIGTTSLLSSSRRLGYVLASAANNLATGWTLNGSTALLWRGNANGLGGFFFHARFGFNILTAGNRHMIGMTASATTTGDPSAAVNACFVGKDAADTNWQIMFNAGSGTCTKVDTGIAPATDKLYDVFIFAVPNGSSIKFALLSYDNTGAVDNSFEYEAVANLPVATTLLVLRVLSGSGTATTGAQIDILQAYSETDF